MINNIIIGITYISHGGAQYNYFKPVCNNLCLRKLMENRLLHPENDFPHVIQQYGFTGL